MPEVIKPVLVFRSDRFSTAWPSDGSDPNTPPLGRDVALFLLERLVKSGFGFDHDPINGEGGWWLTVSGERHKYSAFVLCAALGDPPVDHWIVQLTVRSSHFIDMLLGVSKQTCELKPFIDALQRIIHQESDVFIEPSWMSMDQLSRIY